MRMIRLVNEFMIIELKLRLYLLDFVMTLQVIFYISTYFHYYSFVIATPSHLWLARNDSLVTEQFVWVLEPIPYFEVFVGSNCWLGKNICETSSYANFDCSNSFEMMILG